MIFSKILLIYNLSLVVDIEGHSFPQKVHYKARFGHDKIMHYPFNSFSFDEYWKQIKKHFEKCSTALLSSSSSPDSSMSYCP